MIEHQILPVSTIEFLHSLERRSATPTDHIAEPDWYVASETYRVDLKLRKPTEVSLAFKYLWSLNYLTTYSPQPMRHPSSDALAILTERSQYAVCLLLDNLYLANAGQIDPGDGTASVC